MTSYYDPNCLHCRAPLAAHLNQRCLFDPKSTLMMLVIVHMAHTKNRRNRYNRYWRCGICKQEHGIKANKYQVSSRSYIEDHISACKKCKTPCHVTENMVICHRMKKGERYEEYLSGAATRQAARERAGS